MIKFALTQVRISQIESIFRVRMRSKPGHMQVRGHMVTKQTTAGSGMKDVGSALCVSSCNHIEI